MINKSSWTEFKLGSRTPLYAAAFGQMFWESGHVTPDSSDVKRQIISLSITETSLARVRPVLPVLLDSRIELARENNKVKPEQASEQSDLLPDVHHRRLDWGSEYTNSGNRKEIPLM